MESIEILDLYPYPISISIRYDKTVWYGYSKRPVIRTDWLQQIKPDLL